LIANVFILRFGKVKYAGGDFTLPKQGRNKLTSGSQKQNGNFVKT
jgi:hypothetical protein